MIKNDAGNGLLENINSPDDVKKLNPVQLDELAEEIRHFLVEKVSVTGGHLSSNLGAVELTIALHRVFNTPKDKIVWDVGHQSYVHKILTGRREQFDTLRRSNGISGFPKKCESACDCFNSGHSSTSISAALGIARGRDLSNEQYSVVAVIGDGALTGGMSFEALNDAGRSPNNIIIILNDNEMSISKNVGAFSRYLSKIRSQRFYTKAREDLNTFLNSIPAIGKRAARALVRAKGAIKYIVMPGMIFEEMGLKYLGPIDGHNISDLVDVMTSAKGLKGPVLIHVRTQKGKGYKFAENKPQEFHGIAPFEIETGELKVNNGPSFSDVFGSKMVSIAQNEPRLVAITAAMPLGTGLNEFSKQYPERFFDVGIAEQHAVTMAAGLACAGIKPVVAVYSTFLQRAYDQILHDVALQRLHVVFAVDRAGVIGEDGETHQGLYDISFLNHIPNMTVAAPADYDELESMLEFAISKHDGPIVVRYPRGTGERQLSKSADIVYGKGLRLVSGKEVSIIAVGSMVRTALAVAELLDKSGINAEVINARFVKPLDQQLILESAVKTGVVVTLEDNTIVGGFGSAVLDTLNSNGLKIKTRIFGFPDIPVPQGTRSELYRKYGLNAEAIAEEITKLIEK